MLIKCTENCTLYIKKIGQSSIVICSLCYNLLIWHCFIYISMMCGKCNNLGKPICFSGCCFSSSLKSKGLDDLKFLFSSNNAHMRQDSPEKNVHAWCVCVWREGRERNWHTHSWRCKARICKMGWQSRDPEKRCSLNPKVICWQISSLLDQFSF